MTEKPADDIPATPFTGLPANSLEMIRKFWESASGSGAAASGPMALSGLPTGMPSIMAPTLDVGEIDKHIAELRTVEQWLQLNSSMLRTTIQTLEIQRNTIATLRSFGGAFSDAMQQAGKPTPAPTPQAAPTADRKANTGRKTARSKSTKSTPPPLDPATALKPDPTQWWNALQQQFAQLAEAAIQPAAPAPAAAKTRKRSGG